MYPYVLMPLHSAVVPRFHGCVLFPCCFGMYDEIMFVLFVRYFCMTYIPQLELHLPQLRRGIDRSSSGDNLGEINNREPYTYNHVLPAAKHTID